MVVSIECKSLTDIINMTWLALVLAWCVVSSLQKSSTHKPPTKIAFGSCNRFYESHKMDIFERIVEQKPSHMFFLGDFVYLDKFMYPNLPTVWYSELDDVEILRKFNSVLESKQFKAFMNNNITVQVVWDDHDYNQNNGGTTNPMRFRMLEVFKTFFKTKAIFEDSLHKMIKVDQKVTAILLDVRSYKTEDNMFNEQTWLWLQSVLKITPKDQLILLGSGIQVIYDDRILMEKWDLSSRVRLYKLLQKYQTHVIVLSGDVHFAQIGYRQGLHEVTSSGLSFSVADHLILIQQILDNFIPDTYSNSSQRFPYRNFGIIEVSYNKDGSIDQISAQIRNKDGEQVLQRRIPFQQTVVRQVDWADIEVDHKYLFQKNMRQKIMENPLRILVYIPFMYPMAYFLLVIIEMCHWKID